MKINNQLLNIAYEFYLQGNTLKETAEFLDKYHLIKIHYDVLSRYFRKCGFSLRSNKESKLLSHRKHIDTKEILQGYKTIKSIRELSKRFKITRNTIVKILRENNIPIRDSRSALIAIDYIKEKNKFVLSPQEKAYLFALVMGDLTPVKKSNYTLKLITHSTHKTFMDFLCKTFGKYGPACYKTTKDPNMFRFQSYMDLESFSFLLYSKKGIIPNWINSENFFDYLGGFIDSDGSIMLKRMGNGIFCGVRLFGQNFELLSKIKRKLEILGFDSSIHKSHAKGEIRYHNGVKFGYNKDYYILETKRNQAAQLLKLIPIRHPEKILKKELIFKIYNQNIIHWNKVEKEINELRILIKEAVKSKRSLDLISPLNISDGN